MREREGVWIPSEVGPGGFAAGVSFPPKSLKTHDWTELKYRDLLGDPLESRVINQSVNQSTIFV